MIKYTSIIDDITKEIIEEVPTISMNTDKNFEKIWLGHIVDALDMIGNQKIKVILHMMKHRTKSNNMFLGTQREIAKDTGVSLKTVNFTIKALKEANFLQEVRSGNYQLNPDFIFKGQSGNRMRIMLEYNKIGDEDK